MTPRVLPMGTNILEESVVTTFTDGTEWRWCHCLDIQSIPEAYEQYS